MVKSSAKYECDILQEGVRPLILLEVKWMSQYRVGIIGFGSIFPMHARSISRQANAHLAAVCDINPERARARADEYNCSFYVDYREMIAQANLDVVHICTPHYLHAPMAIFAAEHGVHVLTEKPMAISNEEAYAMIKAAEENNVVLSVIFQNRFNPGSQLVKKVMESGELGRVLASKLSVTWQRTKEYYTGSDWKGTWDQEGGGVVINQAIHTFDLARWFIGSEIESVDATISTRVLGDVIEVEDCAEGIIRFENGVITCFQALNYYGCSIPVELELHCEHGTARIIGDTGIVKFNDGREMRAVPNPKELIAYGSAKSYWGVSHIKQITDFYHALEQGIEPAVTARDAVKTQELVSAIYESGKKRQKAASNVEVCC